MRPLANRPATIMLAFSKWDENDLAAVASPIYYREDVAKSICRKVRFPDLYTLVNKRLTVDIKGLMMLAEAEPKAHRRRNEAPGGASRASRLGLALVVDPRLRESASLSYALAETSEGKPTDGQSCPGR